MDTLVVRPLGPETWPDFAALVEANSGVWGGCWCMGFHAKTENWGRSADGNRADKEALVRAGKAHAALVYHDDACLGWCQFGPPADLPRIKNARAYASGAADQTATRPAPSRPAPPRPDWRITCFFTGNGHPGRGVATAGLRGALALIGGLGGGLVEGFPEDTAGRKVSGSFLFNGSLALFEAEGFTRDRLIGKAKWVVHKQVLAADPSI